MPSLASIQRQKHLIENARQYISEMSSGHAVVLLTITKLVEYVEEKTLVLFDEPESHLHPPLLSAFVRALSKLLYDRNGVAILATHSPVVLQKFRSHVFGDLSIGLEDKVFPTQRGNIWEKTLER